jgi:hypothetical protein
MGATEDVEFIAVGAVDGQPPRAPAQLAPPAPDPAPEISAAQDKAGSIEIALPNGAPIKGASSARECISPAANAVL